MKGKMKIFEIQTRTPQLIEDLMSVWEDTVRATHLFLSDAEVKSIKEYVPHALKNVEHLIVSESKKSVAFMGTQKGRLEMLFISPNERGIGIGKQLLQYGKRQMRLSPGVGYYPAPGESLI